VSDGRECLQYEQHVTRLFSGARRVPGWVESVNYPQCERSGPWRRHTDAARVRTWSSKAEVETAAMSTGRSSGLCCHFASVTE